MLMVNQLYQPAIHIGYCITIIFHFWFNGFNAMAFKVRDQLKASLVVVRRVPGLNMHKRNNQNAANPDIFQSISLISFSKSDG